MQGDCHFFDIGINSLQVDLRLIIIELFLKPIARTQIGNRPRLIRSIKVFTFALGRSRRLDGLRRSVGAR